MARTTARCELICGLLTYEYASACSSVSAKAGWQNSIAPAIAAAAAMPVRLARRTPFTFFPIPARHYGPIGKYRPHQGCAKPQMCERAAFRRPMLGGCHKCLFYPDAAAFDVYLGPKQRIRADCLPEMSVLGQK